MAAKKRLLLMLERANPIDVYVITRIVPASIPPRKIGRVSARYAQPSDLNTMALV